MSLHNHHTILGVEVESCQVHTTMCIEPGLLIHNVNHTDVYCDSLPESGCLAHTFIGTIPKECVLHGEFCHIAAVKGLPCPLETDSRVR